MGNIGIRLIGITDLDTDCIVNAANSSLAMGSGVCGAIFRAAGAKELQSACDAIGHCPTGGAVITPGFALKAGHVIHAVGPIYDSSNKEQVAGELYSAYKESLDLARKNDCKSIGFPLISTGIFGYPKQEAWEIAIKACKDWLHANADYPMEIVFAIIDEATLKMGKAIAESGCATDGRGFTTAESGFITEENRIYMTGDDGKMIAEITFPETADGEFTIDHTFVDESLRGQGMASKLVQAAVDEIEAKGGIVKATCSYAVNWLDKHSK